MFFWGVTSAFSQLTERHTCLLKAMLDLELCVPGNNSLYKMLR